MTKKVDEDELDIDDDAVDDDIVDEDGVVALGSRFSRLANTDDKTLHRFREEGRDRKGHDPRRSFKRGKDREEKDRED